MPVIFDVSSIDQIRGVLALADSFKLKVILRGPRDAWRVADTLAARGIPVIVGPTTQAPGPEDPYDALYAQPGVLAKAGVKIAFQTSSAADVRSLPYNAALSTAYGLDMDEAIKALTINPGADLRRGRQVRQPRGGQGRERHGDDGQPARCAQQREVPVHSGPGGSAHGPPHEAVRAVSGEAEAVRAEGLGRRRAEGGGRRNAHVIPRSDSDEGPSVTVSWPDWLR